MSNNYNDNIQKKRKVFKFFLILHSTSLISLSKLIIFHLTEQIIYRTDDDKKATTQVRESQI
jgi:hypothetical protein